MPSARAHKAERGFEIVEIELSRTLPELRMPEGCRGWALILRRFDKPVGFLMREAPPGSLLSRADLARAIVQELAPRLLEESIFEDLTPHENAPSLPPLTIAICTRSRPQVLTRCLQSIQRLPVGDFTSDGSIELLVVDNAPCDDATARAVSAFPGVRYLVEKRPGLDFARNAAMRAASGELVAYLDDDVTVDRVWLEGLRQAWAAHPDAGAFTGPVLPLDLATRAQITFEQMGGFGRNFYRVRFGREQPDCSSYPCGAGMFGCGCNMVFQRRALLALGGFDEALDTGLPLPGGGDLDMFYRVVRAGYPLVSEPNLLVYHQHRREYAKLRYQMWTWGLGAMAYMTKSYKTDPLQRGPWRRWIVWWFLYQVGKLFRPLRQKARKACPLDLVVAEIAGGLRGLLGEYARSVRRVETRRRLYS